MFVARCTWIAVLAALAVAPAAAAQVSLPDADPGPNAVAPCVPAARTLCVTTAASAEAGGRKLAKATSKPKVRRGLGLPRPKKVLGRRAAKRLAKADRKFASGLAEPLAQASAAAKLRRALSTSSAAGNGTRRESRRAKLEIEVESCPDPRTAADNNGIFAVRGRAEYRLLAIFRHRGRWFVDTVDMSVPISGKGLVNRNAEYAGILPNNPLDRLSLSRSRQRYDPSSGDSYSGYQGQVFFDVLGWDPTAVRFSNDFSDFIDGTDAVGSVGPELTAPDPLRKSAYLTVAKRFMSWVDHELHAVVAEAEQNWSTPNRCVRLDMEGPARLSPSETTSDVIGRLTPVGGVGTKEGLYGRYMTFRGTFIGNGSARTTATLPLDMEEKWFEYTAPGQPWPDSARPGLDVTAYTKGGIGRAPVTFELTPQELGFKVLSASYTENLAGNADIPGSACNLSDVATSVQQANTMSLGEQPIEPQNRLTRNPDGSMDGLIMAMGMGRTSGTVHGCNIVGEPPWPACTTPFGGDLGGSATAIIHIADRSKTATLQWPMPPLHPNIIDPSVASCLATGFGGDDPNPMPTQQVPADVFFRTGPQTLAFAKGRSLAGDGRSISSTVNYKIVFRRLTDEEMAALGG